MDYVIDSLKFVAFSDKHSLDTADSSKQTATACAQQRGSRLLLPSLAWCRKHNLTFIGHV
jgi:hypothetical protein